MWAQIVLALVAMVGVSTASVISQQNQDAADHLQSQVNQAIAQGLAEVFVPAGDYYFGNHTFLIENATGLSIYCDPGAATLWFWGWRGAVQVQDCSNVTLKGFIMDRNPTPYIRGNVTAVAIDGTYTFQVPEDSLTSLPRYWDLGEAHWSVCTGQFGFTNGKMWNGGCGGFEPDEYMVSWGDRRYNYTKPGSSCGSRFKVGDEFVAITWLGYSYTIANSSHVTTQDVAIWASPYMAVFEVDGHGGHVYRNVSATRGPGKLIGVNADGIHSEDVDVGPLIEDCRISHLLDDYWNIQTTIHMQMGNATTDPASGVTSITLVHPHTGDAPTDGLVDRQYGTSEPLLRLAPGDALRFYDPVTYAYLGDRVVTAYPQPLPAGANSTLGRKADGLWDVVSKPPYVLPSFTKQRYRVARFRSTVYRVQLERPPPVGAVTDPALPVPYMVEMAKTQAVGAVIRNSNFSHSTGFFGRFKSSDARIEGNRFAYNGNEELELSMLPNYFEGPVELSNITITGNTFGCGSTKAIDEVVFVSPAAVDISAVGNTVVVLRPPPPPPTPPPQPTPPPPPAPPAEHFAGYSAFPGVDITNSDDDYYRGFCNPTPDPTNATAGLWQDPTAVCDLLGCAKVGLQGPDGPPIEPAPASINSYCVKGWGNNKGSSTTSYLSLRTCGGGVSAMVINGSCNAPYARYVKCPDGAGDVKALQQLPGVNSAAVKAACDADSSCVGFLVHAGGGGTLLQYGYGGFNYKGYVSYTRLVTPV